MGQEEEIYRTSYFNGKDCTYAAVTDDAVGTRSKIPQDQRQLPDQTDGDRRSGLCPAVYLKFIFFLFQ